MSALYTALLLQLPGCTLNSAGQCPEGSSDLWVDSEVSPGSRESSGCADLPTVLVLRMEMQACRALHESCSFGVLKRAFAKFPQLALASIAPYILLTRPAALGFMAHLITHAGLMQVLDKVSHLSARFKIHPVTVMDGARLLGMPAATRLSCKHGVSVSSV